MKINYDYVLKNGEAVLKNKNEWQLLKTDIGFKAGKVTHIGDVSPEEAQSTIDCSGLTILPGLIDSQVHFREPGLEYKEDLESGSRAAVVGGVTAIFDMPNTKPSITNLKTWQQKINCAHECMWCDYAFYMGATLNNIEDLPSLEKQRGCCGIKIFMGSSTGDLLVDELTGLKQILSSINRNVALHSENEQMLKDNSHLREKGNPQSHTLWRNEEVAFTSTQNLIRIAKEVQKRVHVLHVSTFQEMELLKNSKDICTVEVTPQHLTLTAPEAYERLGTYAQMNPPIRTKEHQKALWQALNEGIVDVLGSDHAPHTREEKDKDYPLSPSGMPGVQTIVPVMLNHVHQKNLSLFRLVELMAERPAEIFNLKNKGNIELGRDADFTIVDLKKNWKIENSWIESKCKWTPFAGMEITGKPEITIIRGNIVYREGQILGKQKGLPLEFTDL